MRAPRSRCIIRVLFPPGALLTSQRPSSFEFFKTFLANPGQVGAVLPSGEALAAEMVRQIDFERARVLVEFGPGTGVFTRELLRHKHADARVIAFEVNPRMADWVASDFPEVELVRDGAQNIARHLEERGFDHADAIVSGLPFAAFPPRLRDRILLAAAEALPEGAPFVSFTYYHSHLVPATHAYRARLKRLFSRVDRVPVVRNVPPAFVYRCRK